MADTTKPATPTPTDATAPEETTDRNPQNGQSRTDRSLVEGDPDDLPDGGAKSSRHTGDASRH